MSLTPYWFRDDKTLWFIDKTKSFRLDKEGPFYNVSQLGTDRKFKVVGAVPVMSVKIDKAKHLIDSEFLQLVFQKK